MPFTPTEWAESQAKDLPLPLKPEDCEGKTYIVTGANSGIGYECAKHLVKLDAARVIIAVRDVNKGEAARKTIEADAKRQDVVEVYRLDLASFESVQHFVEQVSSNLDRLDAVIANAGVSNSKWMVAEGMESCVTVNLVSQILMLALLVPHLKNKTKGRESGANPRFTLVGSLGTFLSPKPLLADVNQDDILDDLNNEQEWASDLETRYLTTKLLLHLAIRQLTSISSASQTGVTINIADPGMCKTALNRNAGWGLWLKSWVVNFMLGRTPEMGSRAILAGLTVGDESHGKLVADCEIADGKVAEWMNEDEGKQWQARIWEELTTKLAKVHPGCLSWVQVG